jgi:hypothetical protein
MSEVAASLPPLGETQPLDVLLGQVLVAVREGQRARSAGEMNEVVFWTHRLAEVEAAVRAAALLDGVGALRPPPALEAAPAAAPGRPRSHRKTRRDPGPHDRPLWSVEGLAALPVAAKVAAIVVAAGVVAGGALHAVLAHPSAATPSVSASAPGSAPDFGIPAPGPSSSLIALTKPRTDAAKAGTVAQDIDAPPSYVPPSSQPSSTPSSSPSPSATVAGELQVSHLDLDLGTATSMTVTLHARLGAVAWTAGTVSPDVSLDSYGGTIPVNGSVTVTVTVDALDSLTDAIVTFAGGGQDFPVTVTWTLPALLSSPGASPSPSSS